MGRNVETAVAGMSDGGRPPCEGVGRNGIRRIWEEAGLVALHVRAWVEIAPSGAVPRLRYRRPPCEGVGRNHLPLLPLKDFARRPPCEGVGRNRALHGANAGAKVALHVRAWVEISQ